VILISAEKFGVDREVVRLALEEENIEARPVWKPMHMQPVFDTGRKAAPLNEKHISQGIQGKRQNTENIKRRYKARLVKGEVAEDLFNRGLCLPSGTALTEKELDRVVSVIRGCKR
jgi:dTDP-4-amino-4,6-dideoxygalactose transaminase